MGNITRRPTVKNADAFINAAPDATVRAAAAAAALAATKTNRMKGNQMAITFTLPPELLAKVDEAADSLSISRAAFIKQALSKAVAEGT